MLTCRMWVTCVKYPVAEMLQGRLCQLSRGNPGEQAGGLDILWALFALPVEAVQEHCIASSASRAGCIFHPITSKCRMQKQYFTNRFKFRASAS